MATLKVAIVPVTPFEQNCSIVWDADTMRAAIVDPGGDLPRIQGAIADLKVLPEKILLTHGHIDHAGGAAELAELLSIPIEGSHADDAPLLANLTAQAQRFGLAGVRPVTPTRWLKEGDTVTVGGLTFDVLHVPGHAPGHVVYVHAPSEFALVGDTVFQGSVGRTDLPGGDHAGARAQEQSVPAVTSRLAGHRVGDVYMPTGGCVARGASHHTPVA